MGSVDDRPIRHVVFNPSARASLVQALRSLGRPDDVVALFDDLRCGPLDPTDLRARERWFNEVLGADYERGLIRQCHTEFWPKALDPDRRLIAWTTRHGAQDWIGFLFWAARLSEAPADVIDISDVLFQDWRDPNQLERRSVSMVTPDAMIELGLIDFARPVAAEERAEAQAEVARLVAEDGAFRAIHAGTPVSLPITAYDEQLLSKTSKTLKKAARVIGEVFADMDGQTGWPLNDLALVARLCALVEADRLEAEGDIYGDIRYWQVRLPVSQQ